MNNRYIKLGVATFAISLGLSACGDDVLLSEEHFTTVNSLNAEDCNDETEGSMAFVKSTATMYACSEGEWIAMSDKEAIKYRCSSKELSDKSGFAIICDGDTIGVVNNGKDGANGKDGINGKDGANGQNGSDGTNGTNGKDGDPGTNGSNGVSVDTAAINKAIRDAFSSASAKSQSDVNNAINAMNSAASQNQSDVNNALKNLSSASAKNQSDVNNALKNLSSASAKNQDDVNNALKNLSSASAKNQSDVNNALNDLSSASAKNQNDLNNALGNLSSATDKFGEDINKKFNDAYSSWNAELKDRSCAITDTVRDYEKAIITVTIHCGDAETTMDLPFTIVNKNLTNVYKKHVVVRLPVQSTKETKTQDIYEEIWKNFKGGDNAELSVIDLDTNYNATGKLFIADLFADASKAKSFVTIEETNEKIVEYKVVRLEGDLDVTNLTTPIAQLRVKLNLTSPAGFSAFGGFGSNGTDVIYNALVDLTDADPEAQDASDTVVIDFLTDYKAARTKVELKSSATFAEASAKANKELAAALNLKYKNSDEYPAFEHYLPTQIDLEEYFNSVVWVMALIDQKDKTPGFNAVYNAYRDLFAEKGNFKTAVKTTYAGREQDMFLVDYIALLIDANFVQWAHWTNEGAPYQNRWTGSDAGYYKIVQDGFVHSYGLTTAGLVPYADYPDKLFKSDAKGGYFRYFVYYEESKTWWPLGLDAAAVATVEGIACDANTVGNTYLYSFEGLDDNAVCTCENDQCYWEWSQNVCVGRSAGDKGTAVYVYEGGYVDILDYECVAVDCDGSETSECVEVVTNWGSLFSSSSANSSSSSAEQNGKTPEEVANDPSSKLYLGTCDATNQGSEKQFNHNNAQLATTTGMVTYVCDGVRWRQKTYEDEMYGTCTKSKMEEALVKDDYNGSDVYKCEYLDKQDKYDWIAVKGGIYFNDEIEKACHYGIADKNVFSRYGSYICATKKRQDDNGNNVDALDNEGNHIHEWRVATVDEYCVDENIEATEQKVADEDLGEFTFNQKCTFQEKLYVRNSKAGANSPWMSVEDYVARAPQGVIRRTAPNAATAAVVAKRYIPEGYFLFMNGYKENAIYYCRAKYFSCQVAKVEDVKKALANTQNDIEIQKLLNIVCDYEGYTKASGYADEAVAYVAENVQLSEAEIKKTYVASAKRNDWHVATLNDILGECNRNKMSNQSSLSVYNRTNYKCDYIESNSGSYYTWREASELDANATLGICTYNRDEEVVKVNDMYYECKAHEVNSSTSRDWKEYSESE